MATPQMSEFTTQGIRIGASAFYLEHESDPGSGHYIFGYNIVIQNNSDQTVKLEKRHWVIIDGDGQEHTVNGDGVVGMTPTLEPGQAFKYSSYCPLKTTWGTMQGHYEFSAENDQMFSAKVDRFWLTTEKS